MQPPEAHHSESGRRAVPVLEIGGSHVASAVVGWPPQEDGLPAVRGPVHRVPLDPHWGADALIGAFVNAGNRLGVDCRQRWAVAIPGPFDYAKGIGLYTGDDVGKFESLRNVNLRAQLTRLLRSRPSSVLFLNDADAFALGEHAVGAGRGYDRAVFLTIGSGVGSAFLNGGAITSYGPDVPPGGEAYRIIFQGRPLEDTVSRRAIRRQYRSATGCDADLLYIASMTRSGQPAAMAVMSEAMRSLGQAIGPWCKTFRAQALIIGGAVSASWDVIADPIRLGLADELGQDSVPVIRAEMGTDGPLIGAGIAAERDHQLPSR